MVNPSVYIPELRNIGKIVVDVSTVDLSQYIN